MPIRYLHANDTTSDAKQTGIETMYQVIKNGQVMRETKSEDRAIDYARCLMAEGFTGSITVEIRGVVVFMEQN